MYFTCIFNSIGIYIVLIYEIPDVLFPIFSTIEENSISLY